MIYRLPAIARLAAVNLFVLFALILGAEALLAIAGIGFPAIGRPGDRERGAWRYDPTKGWSLTPNTTVDVSIAGSGERTETWINASGFRGPIDSGSGLRSHAQRVVVLGDSFVFGLGVSDQHLATAVLERLLRSSLTGVQVVNLGVSGYSTDQELILLREQLPRLKPSIVVLVMCDNDFAGNVEDFAYLAYYKPYFTTANGLALHNVPVPRLSAPQRAKLWLGRYSILWNAVRSRRSANPLAWAALEGFQVATPRTTTERPVVLAATLVLQMRAEVEAAGGRFLVTNTGHRGESLEHFTPLRRRYLRPAGVNFIRMEEHLEKARLADPTLRWDFPLDSHWNIDSHRVAAETLYAAIVPLLSADRPAREGAPTSSP